MYLSVEVHTSPSQEIVDGFATKLPLFPHTFFTFAILIELHFAEGLQHVSESVATQGTPAHFVPTNFLRLDMDDDDMPMVPNKLVLLLPAGVQT